ncbi:MAG: hypothetical protein GYA51_07300 [Candidatus Methanofastidiosa archaeon]|nr:hypothetical protein [Candidatus Methanofastidiosa archaeon]
MGGGDYYKLNEIPFISNIPKDGRIIPLSPFFDENEKKYRLIIRHKGKYLEIVTGDPVKSTYWSKKIVNQKEDLHMRLIHVLTNNFSFPDIEEKNKGLSDLTGYLIQDIHNFGAVIHKQFILWDYISSTYEKPSDSSLYDLYIVEIEYLMGLVRSFFDLIYNIFTILMNGSKIKLKISLKKRKTLGSFSDKIIKDIEKSNGKLSQTDVLTSYGLPDPFIKFFDEILPLFRLTRKIRDAIFHSGKTLGTIFLIEKGPGISMQKLEPYINDPFSSFKDFFINDENFANNLLKHDIASLFYFVNRIIEYSLEYAELFCHAIIRVFKVPENISNDYLVCITGPEIKHINKIPDYLDQVWLEL